MPRYDWKCDTCGSVTEVTRRMSSCGVPPLPGENPCGCISGWSRVVSVPLLSFGDSVGKKNIRFPFSQVVGGERMVFHSMSDMNAKLERKGYVVASSLYDSSVSRQSQHSAWDANHKKALTGGEATQCESLSELKEVVNGG